MDYNSQNSPTSLIAGYSNYGMNININPIEHHAGLQSLVSFCLIVRCIKTPEFPAEMLSSLKLNETHIYTGRWTNLHATKLLQCTSIWNSTIHKLQRILLQAFYVEILYMPPTSSPPLTITIGTRILVTEYSNL